MKKLDPGCAACAVIEQFNLPAGSFELFHRYVQVIDESLDVLDEAIEEGFDFNEGAFKEALDALFEVDDEVPPKSQLN